MAVSMTLRNPNKRLGHKTEKNVSTVIKGQQVMVFGNGYKEKYDGERKDNVYNIDLKLRLKIRFKVFGIKSLKKFTRKYNPGLNSIKQELREDFES
ncbi:hypothetical protein Tco_0221311 [Tanacetum coccineum]